MPARSTAALIATAPSSLAASDAKSPWKPPIGVRAAPTMTIGSFSMACSFRSRSVATGVDTDLGDDVGVHLVSLNSSRPISMRRISEVPAPIS